MPKVKSEAQARFLGAVAGGATETFAGEPISLSEAKAREMLRGMKIKKLPEKVKKKKK